MFIPGGCPHQVRNLRSCLKVAVDFVSPESVGECLSMARQLRGCGFEDKLQGRAMVGLYKVTQLESAWFRPLNLKI